MELSNVSVTIKVERTNDGKRERGYDGADPI